MKIPNVFFLNLTGILRWQANAGWNSLIVYISQHGHLTIKLINTSFHSN